MAIRNGSADARHDKSERIASGYLEHAIEEINFSARAHDRILKMARMLADLAAASEIRPSRHPATAVLELLAGTTGAGGVSAGGFGGFYGSGLGEIQLERAFR
jgi:hypothetical protein